ncbi:hypothetical protein FHX42_005174 [Saccharopolyspora lacisalsi]|uniref:Uncharacterized protein n=1 Tax=Halosaccharopolyspora lacisalsi TaxID=1000566 RepID=A0A839E7T9_9PSEU|nr:hypothetical protein [Halosaccharopolyspora lacisalsi]MBA8827767.1 hypothetical protein [Halosaccharopolyspora lacisalsi]
MSQPDEPPTLALRSDKMQEIAMLTMFATRGLKRLQRHLQNRDSSRAWKAARDVQAGKDGLKRASGDQDAATDEVPRPMDEGLFQQAAELATQESERVINQPVSLERLGRSTWAVTGTIPTIGDVGIEVASQQQAQAMYEHMRTAPAEELGSLALTSEPIVPERRFTREAEQERLRQDYTDLVATLDNSEESKALARHLRDGADEELRQRIHSRFGDSLDTPPPAPAPPTPAPAAQSESSTATAAEHGAAEEAAGAAEQPAEAPSIGTTVTGPDGSRATVVSQEEAMQLYPEPGQNTGIEIRDADGNLRPLTDDDGVSFVQGLDYTQESHRKMGSALYGTGDDKLNEALKQQFPGLETAMNGYAEQREAALAAQQQTQSGNAHEQQKEQAQNASTPRGRAQAAAGAGVSPTKKAAAKKAAQQSGGGGGQGAPTKQQQPPQQQPAPTQQPPQQPSR